MTRARSIRNTDLVDPQLLRTFVTVARCGSFSEAARQLGYTQSAVSQQIATLETDIGAVLLHRRPVGPTTAGERLLDHAAAILLRLDAARADVRLASGEPPGVLQIGLTPLASPALVSTALAGLRRDRPGLEVVATVTGRETVVTSVARGDFGLGLIDGVAAPNDPLPLYDAGHLSAEVVAEDAPAVVLPAGHPLASRKGLGLDDLADARWIDAPDVAAPLADLRAAADTDRLRASIRYDGTDLPTLLALVAAGHGLAVLPSTAVAGMAGVTAVQITTPRLVHRTELLHGLQAARAAVDLGERLTASQEGE